MFCSLPEGRFCAPPSPSFNIVSSLKKMIIMSTFFNIHSRVFCLVLVCVVFLFPVPSSRQHPSYGDRDCLEDIKANIIKIAMCWIVTRSLVSTRHHTYMSSSYRSNRLAIAMRRGGCLELYYLTWWSGSYGIQARDLDD